MTQEQLQFETKDIFIASVLLTLGQKLIRVDKKDPRSALFCFQRDSKTEAIIESYWARDLKLIPQSLFSAFKEIKQRLYSNY